MKIMKSRTYSPIYYFISESFGIESQAELISRMVGIPESPYKKRSGLQSHLSQVLRNQKRCSDTLKKALVSTLKLKTDDKNYDTLCSVIDEHNRRFGIQEQEPTTIEDGWLNLLRTYTQTITDLYAKEKNTEKRIKIVSDLENIVKRYRE